MRKIILFILISVFAVIKQNAQDFEFKSDIKN